MRLLVLFGLTAFFNMPLSNATDLNGYKASCSDIGFIPKTPAFGDCVLELRKRDQTIQAQAAKRNTNIMTDDSKATENFEAQATEFFRRQQDELQKRNDEDYARRFAEYERQKADYNARLAEIEKEKQRQKGLKLLEFGLRMGAGQSVRDASLAAAGMAPIPPTPANSNSLLPSEIYRITTPSGNSINCRYDPNIKKAVCY